MSELSHWRHAEWQHDDEKRFQRMLGLSVLLHALLLLTWKLPPQVWRAADHAVLTVVVRTAVPLPPSKPTPAEQKREVAVLMRKEPTPAAFSVPPKPAVRTSEAELAAGSPPALSASQARLATQPTQDRSSNSAPAAVGVTVILVTDAEGRAQRIFWDKLPALTDEQLRRVEAAIREKTYAPGQTINEIFDVRGFLKLAPARTEEGLVPALPPATE